MVSRLDINKKSNTTPLRMAEDTKQELNTFDISKVKSSVTNPSAKYKWISVDDEAKIDRIVSEKLPNWTPWQISDMTQWLYSVALNEQKKKDIQAGRDKVMMELEYLASNSNWRQKSEYNTQIKRAKLADLIRETNGKIPYEMTDNAIIKETLKKYPEYNDEFLKFYYDNRTKDELAKDLWWVEETKWDNVKDRISNMWEWFMWFMPKLPEWVKDYMDLLYASTDQYNTKDENLNKVAFSNYVEDKYWTYPANLTEKDYWQAMKDFQATDKKAYTPTLTSATTKTIEWATDVAYTAAWWVPRAIKAWFSIAWNVPVWEDVMWALATWITWMWWLFNQIPWFNKIRDSLQTEEEKQARDMFMWWYIISRAIKWAKWYKNRKYVNSETYKNAINELKRWWEEAINDLKKWINIDNMSNAFYDLWAWNKLAANTYKWDVIAWKKQMLQTLKEKQAQKISQWELWTRAGESKTLDVMEEEWKLKWTQSPEELSAKVKEKVDELQEKQNKAAEWDKKLYWEKELTDMAPQEQPDWSMKDVPVKPYEKALNELIKHYKWIDKVKAWTWQKFLDAYKNWKATLKNILRVKREMNTIHQKEFSKWEIKDTTEAKNFKTAMERLNNMIEKMEMWKDIREADKNLSNAYTLKNDLDVLIKDAADIEKKMSEWMWEKAWRTLARLTNKLSFWLNNFIAKLVTSYFQASIDTAGRMDAFEISQNMKSMIKNYRALSNKIKNAWKPWFDYSALSKDISAFLTSIWENDED